MTQDVGQLTSTLRLDWSEYDKGLSDAEARLKQFEQSHADFSARITGGGGGGGGRGGGGGGGGIPGMLDVPHGQVGEIERLAGAMRQGSQVAGEFGAGSEKVAMALGALELRAAGAGVGIAAAGVVVLAATEKFIGMGVASERAGAQLQAWGGQTEEQVGQIRKAFVGMAGDTGIAAEENVKAFTAVAPQIQAYTGQVADAAKARELMTAADRVAIATGQDLMPVTRAIADSATTFGVSYERAGDILTRTSEVTGQSVGAVSDTFGMLHFRLGSVAPTMEDTSALILDLGKSGISGGYGLRAATTGVLELMGGSKDSREELTRLGVSVYDVNNNVRDFGQVMPDVLQKMQGWDDPKIREALKILAPGEAEALFPVVKAGPQGWQAAQDAVKGPADAAQQSAVQLDTASGAWQRFWSALHSGAGAAADTAVQSIERVVKGVPPPPPEKEGGFLERAQRNAVTELAGLRQTGGYLAKEVGTEPGQPGYIGSFTDRLGDLGNFIRQDPEAMRQTLVKWGAIPETLPKPAAGSIEQHVQAGGVPGTTGEMPGAGAAAAPPSVYQPGSMEQQTATAQADVMRAQAALTRTQGRPEQAAAMERQATAIGGGMTFEAGIAGAQGQKADVELQQRLLGISQETRPAEFGQQAQLAGIQGTPAVQAAYVQAQAAYGPGGTPEAQARADAGIRFAQMGQQIEMAGVQRETQPQVYASEAGTAAAQGMNNYAEALLRAEEAARSGTPADQARAAAMLQVAQAADQLPDIQSKMSVQRTEAGTGAIQTGTNMMQQQYSFAAMPSGEQGAVGGEFETYIAALQRVQSAQQALANANPGNQRELSRGLDEAKASADQAAAAFEKAQTSVTGLGSALSGSFGKPTTEELGTNVQQAGINYQIAQITGKYAQKGEFVPWDSPDWQQIESLASQSMQAGASGGVAKAGREYLGAQVAAGMPSSSLSEMQQMASQYLPQLPGYASGATALPSATVSALPGPGVAASAQGGIHVTVEVSGQMLGEAAANEIHDGMGMQIGLAPGGSGGG